MSSEKINSKVHKKKRGPQQRTIKVIFSFEPSSSEEVRWRWERAYDIIFNEMLSQGLLDLKQEKNGRK